MMADFVLLLCMTTSETVLYGTHKRQGTFGSFFGWMREYLLDNRKTKIHLGQSRSSSALNLIEFFETHLASYMQLICLFRKKRLNYMYLQLTNY